METKHGVAGICSICVAGTYRSGRVEITTEQARPVASHAEKGASWNLSYSSHDEADGPGVICYSSGIAPIGVALHPLLNVSLTGPIGTTSLGFQQEHVCFGMAEAATRSHFITDHGEADSNIITLFSKF